MWIMNQITLECSAKIFTDVVIDKAQTICVWIHDFGKRYFASSCHVLEELLKRNEWFVL